MNAKRTTDYIVEKVHEIPLFTFWRNVSHARQSGKAFSTQPPFKQHFVIIKRTKYSIENGTSTTNNKKKYVNFKQFVCSISALKKCIKRDLILYVSWPWQSETLLATDTLYQPSHSQWERRNAAFFYRLQVVAGIHKVHFDL